MEWGTILTSGITSAIIGGAVSYIVSRRLQTAEWKYQERKEKERRREDHEARLRNIELNYTQRQLLRYCRANPSERYALQSTDGTNFLTGSGVEGGKEFQDSAMREQIRDMEDKYYVKIWEDESYWLTFELTRQGKEQPIE